jgi:uncharacterized protein YcaQ
VDAVFRLLRLIQYDPLNPCGRNPDLVLQARIGDYRVGDYGRWLYTERKGIDCYDKELCIVPLDDIPLTLHRHELAKSHPYWKQFIRKHRSELERLMQRIEREGPVSSADIGGPVVASNWGSGAQFGRMALETLWKVGRLAVVRREGTRKFYDLPHRILPGAPGSVEKRLRYLNEEHILRRVDSVGMLPKTGTQGGWIGLSPAADRAKVVKRLLKDGRLVHVAIEGSTRPYVVRAEDLDMLVNAEPLSEKDRSMVFLAPLDNLMWDRDMIHDLFGFFYRWEVYTPVAKRVYGYYVLPILFGDRLVGRIEPVMVGDVLEIRGFWKEEGTAWGRHERTALAEALEAFKNYLGATRITGVATV